MKPHRNEQACEEFRKLNINGRERQAGDDFYEKYGAGVNFVVQDRSLDRFRADEQLPEDLSKTDLEKLGRIHKGTFYYFLFWNAYDCEMYDKALFYLDAAICEDIQHHGAKWTNSQAASYVWLSNDDPKGGARLVVYTKTLLEGRLKRFNSVTGGRISTTDFLSKCVTKLMDRPSTRSIVTAFYLFLLESEQRVKELQLGSRHGRSMQSPLDLLFKGGLLFESLLKSIYPTHKMRTLESIFKDTALTTQSFGLTTPFKRAMLPAR